MRVALAYTDDLLRGAGRFLPARWSQQPAWWLPAIVLIFGPIYGGVMGSFQLDSGERVWQVVFAAVKVPLLLFASTALCIPAFFVLNTVFGLRQDFRDAMQAVLAGQAGLSVALASLSPLTRFWYFSSSSYRGALLFSAAMFTVAAVAGQIVMWRYYRVLIHRHRAHGVMLFAWLVLYAFVGIQMGWLLRPFVGSPGMSVSFFRQHPFSNAYVVVFHLLFG